MRFRGQGLQLNRAHPLARGLVAYIVFGKAQGWGYDLVSGKRFATFSGTPAIGRTQEGIGFDASGTAAISASDLPAWNVVGDVTVAWRGIIRSTAAAGNLICKMPFVGNGATLTAYSLEYTNPTANRLSFARSNTNYRVWQSGSDLVRAGALQTFSVSQTAEISNPPTFYADGRPDIVAAANQYGGAGSGPPTSTNYDLILGRRPDGAEQLDGIAMVALVAGRLWSAAEHALFNDDPYALIVGSSRPLEASADVTVGLTGLAGTFAQGTLGRATDKGITGNAGTFAQGTLAPSLAKGLTGQALASGIGTLDNATDIGLTGVAGTFGIGTLSTSGDVTTALTGVSGTFGQGSLTPSGGDVGITDTHDGVRRRQERAKRLQALQAQTDQERLDAAMELRQTLEAALGVVAAVPDAVLPAEIKRAVAAAPKPEDVNLRRVSRSPERLASLETVVTRLADAVARAEAVRALAEDDDDVAIILGMV